MTGILCLHFFNCIQNNNNLIVMDFKYADVWKRRAQCSFHFHINIETSQGTGPFAPFLWRSKLLLAITTSQKLSWSALWNRSLRERCVLQAQWFSTLAACWNHLESFKKFNAWFPPQDANLIGLVCGLPSGISKENTPFLYTVLVSLVFWFFLDC